MGRFGSTFWAFEEMLRPDGDGDGDGNGDGDTGEVMTPDIVTMGKPFGNGFPLAVSVCVGGGGGRGGGGGDKMRIALSHHAPMTSTPFPRPSFAQQRLRRTFPTASSTSTRLVATPWRVPRASRCWMRSRVRMVSFFSLLREVEVDGARHRQWARASSLGSPSSLPPTPSPPNHRPPIQRTKGRGSPALPLARPRRRAVQARQDGKKPDWHADRLCPRLRLVHRRGVCLGRGDAR